jgi:HPt (histidine-containing phosphotransfer) domain-containing protein
VEHRIGHLGAHVSLSLGPTTGAGEPQLVDVALVTEIERAIGRDALASLVYRHLDGVARSLEMIEAWCGSGEWSEVRREAHRMKGSAATLGFVRLSELWVEVEDRSADAADASADAADADIKPLAARIRIVHRELRDWAASQFPSAIGVV